MEPTIIVLPEPNATPYLSVVAASRNDVHSGDPIIRTQIFIKKSLHGSARNIVCRESWLLLTGNRFLDARVWLRC